MKKILLFILLGIGFISAQAQQNIKEEVYLHLSSADLIVGESLYFSAYTYSAQTGRLSGLSSLLYVELIDYKGDPVFQSKFEQHDGRSSGSIFLPTSLETGRYRLIAYTRWMQNFEDYYQQSLTIVNPYKAYDGAEETKSKDQEIDFYIEGGKLLSGVENRVLVKIHGDHLPKVRLLAKGGEKVSDLKIDSYGLIDFTFRHKEEESYQLAMEYDDQFQFVDLPLACTSCTGLKVVSKDNAILLQVNSTDDLKNAIGRLEIWSPSRKVKEINTTLNTEHLLKRDELPEGKLVARLLVYEQLVNERVFRNGAISEISQIESPVYQTNEEVEWHADVPTGTHMSVSVKKDYEQQLPAIAAAKDLIVPALDLAISDASLLSEQLVDRLLIASQWSRDLSKVDSVLLMPEYRSGIVQGRVVSADKNYKGVNVVLSFRGADLELDAYQVDQQGRFFLKYDPAFANQNGVVKVLNDEEGKYSIELNQEFYGKYPSAQNEVIKFDSLRQSQIVARMVANQLQNAYYELPEQVDSLRPYGKFGQIKTYVLDEFTRFPTMRDTFIELVIEVGVSKNVNKFKFNMRTRDIALSDPFDPETMVLLDGAFSSAEDVLKLSPYLVERIEVLDRRYFMGDVMFDGVISVQTFDRDGGGTDPVGKSVDLSEVQPVVEEVQTSADSRTPKFNDLLYWNALTETEDGSIDLQFKTSNVPGKYRIQLEGIAPDGQAVSKSYQFEVKQTLP